MLYRGYDVRWKGPQDRGHWEIYDGSKRICSADDGELDSTIDELKEDT